MGGMTKERAKDLLRRKKRASENASYCASVGCCNSDPDAMLLYQPKSWWKKIKKIAKGE